MNGPQSSKPNWPPGAIVLWIAVFLVVDLAMWPVVEASRGDEIGTVLAGAVAGQLGMLAIWAVLGPQRFLVRFLGSFTVTTLLWCGLLAGMVMTGRGPPSFREGAEVTLMLPMVFLAAQFPLWVLKMATGWRIVVEYTVDDPLAMQSRQFGLQEMLGVTTIVAVALGLARLGLPGLDNRGGNVDLSQWSALLFVCLMCSVWSAFSTLPCVWAAFVARSKAAGAVFIAVYAVLMSVLPVVVLCAIARSPGFLGEAWKYSLLLHGSLALVLLGSLHVARAFGYTLLRPRRVRAAAVSAGSCPFADPSKPAPSAAANDVQPEANP